MACDSQDYEYNFNVVHKRHVQSVEEFVRGMVARFEDNDMKGFYPERDLLPGRNIIKEHFRVIKQSRFTILVIDKSFVNDPWPEYLGESTMRFLVVDGPKKLGYSRLIVTSMNISQETIQLTYPQLNIKEVVYFRGKYDDDNLWDKLTRVLKEKLRIEDVIEPVMDIQPIIAQDEENKRQAIGLSTREEPPSSRRQPSPQRPPDNGRRNTGDDEGKDEPPGTQFEGSTRVTMQRSPSGISQNELNDSVGNYVSGNELQGLDAVPESNTHANRNGAVGFNVTPAVNCDGDSFDVVDNESGYNSVRSDENGAIGGIITSYERPDDKYFESNEHPDYILNKEGAAQDSYNSNNMSGVNIKAQRGETQENIHLSTGINVRVDALGKANDNQNLGVQQQGHGELATPIENHESVQSISRTATEHDESLVENDERGDRMNNQHLSQTRERTMLPVSDEDVNSTAAIALGCDNAMSRPNATPLDRTTASSGDNKLSGSTQLDNKVWTLGNNKELNRTEHSKSIKSNAQIGKLAHNSGDNAMIHFPQQPDHETERADFKVTTGYNGTGYDVTDAATVSRQQSYQKAQKMPLGETEVKSVSATAEKIVENEPAVKVKTGTKPSRQESYQAAQKDPVELSLVNNLQLNNLKDKDFTVHNKSPEHGGARPKTSSQVKPKAHSSRKVKNPASPENSSSVESIEKVPNDLLPTLSIMEKTESNPMQQVTEESPQMKQQEEGEMNSSKKSVKPKTHSSIVVNNPASQENPSSVKSSVKVPNDSLPNLSIMEKTESKPMQQVTEESPQMKQQEEGETNSSIKSGVCGEEAVDEETVPKSCLDDTAVSGETSPKSGEYQGKKNRLHVDMSMDIPTTRSIGAAFFSVYNKVSSLGDYFNG